MTITFLGTAAANAFPEAFCKCPNCAQARTLGGPSLRKRSAALINNDLLIDLGPDIMSASHMHGCSLDEVRYCLQTHPHADHLDLSHLLSRSPAYGVVGSHVLDFYASRETLERAAETFERDLAGYGLLSPEAEKYLNIKLHRIQPLESFTVVTKAIRHTPTWSLSQKSMGMKWHTMGWLSQSERLTSGRFSSSCTCRPVFVEIPAHRRVLRSDDGPLGSWPTAQGFPRLTIPPDRFIVFRIRAEQTGRDRGVCNHSHP